MRKISLFVFFIFLFLWVSGAYQYQGFDTYIEHETNRVSFSCTTQCILFLGTKWTYDTVTLDGISGEGEVIVGALNNNNQLIPVTAQTVWSNTTHSFLLQNTELGKIPSTTPIALLFSGTFTANTSTIYFSRFSITHKLRSWRKELRTFDTFKPYTINLLKGAKRNGTPLAKIGLYLFLVSSIILYFFNPKTFLRNTFLFWLALWMFIDLRMWVEALQYYINDYTRYITQPIYQKTYRDREDFYSFVDFARDELKKRNIPEWTIINFVTPNTWPFPDSMIYFLYPYDVKVNYTGNDIAATIYYQWIDKDTLGIDSDESTLTVFSDTAFIHFK